MWGYWEWGYTDLLLTNHREGQTESTAEHPSDTKDEGLDE
jgi:hypothetical protein